MAWADKRLHFRWHGNARCYGLHGPEAIYEPMYYEVSWRRGLCVSLQPVLVAFHLMNWYHRFHNTDMRENSSRRAIPGIEIVR